jgi:hypothetical protein
MDIKIKKTISVSLIILLLFGTLQPLAVLGFGGGVKIPSVGEVASKLEKRYHLNLKEMQSKGEMQNVSEQKMLAPEVSLFFSPTDPRPGEEITAIATPLFFQSSSEDLYYVWYIKRSGCELSRNPSRETRQRCDFDEDGRITVEDWKIEAMRIYASGNFDASTVDYDTSFRDNDGYRAYPGGDSRRQTPSRCYVLDRNDGEAYELSLATSGSFSCPRGTSPRCVENSTLVCSPEESDELGEITETFQEYGICQDIGLSPTCVAGGDALTDSSSGTPRCSDGTPRCVPDTLFEGGEPTCDSIQGGGFSCSEVGSEITSCVASSSVSQSLCGENRIFPNAPGDRTGDGIFGNGEEEFWGTNPEDADTANTGYGDEANVVGRGATKFTWNYQVGDQVGVIVEGTSLIPTKYDDYSNMIMWAFPNNDCSVTGKGSYEASIKGYSVHIPTADMDINDCIPNNLVDPREGGQQENLDISLSYSPDDPINDSSGDGANGSLSVQSSISNSSQDASNVLYEWSVFASSDGSYNPREYSRESGDESIGSWVNITDALLDGDLLSRIEGNNLSSLRIRLGITNDVLSEAGLRIDDVFPRDSGNTGYLRIRLTAKERFSAQSVREGSATAIVRVVNSDAGITAILADLDGNGRFSATGSVICNDETTLRRGTCYVARNEVIALRFDEENMNNYSWTVNGESFSCTSDVSAQCGNGRQGDTIFVPITGENGKRHTVSVTAIDSSTGQPISFSRTFEVTDPFAEIIPTDTDSVWPKYLGYYVDTNGKRFNDISTEVFQTYSGDTANLRALFFPGFIGGSPNTKVYWKTNAILEEAGENATISFPILAEPGSTYTVTMQAVHQQSPEIRDAMKRIWNLSANDTITHRFEKTIQIEVLEDMEYEDLVLDDPRAFFASLAMNASSYVWILVQSLLSIIVAIFLLSVLYSFARSSRE